MMQTDVSSKHLSITGTLFDGPTRLKGVIICPDVSTASTVRFRDGDVSGDILLEIDVASQAEPTTYAFDVPGEGIRFKTALFLELTAAVTGVTAFYG